MPCKCRTSLNHSLMDPHIIRDEVNQFAHLYDMTDKVADAIVELPDIEISRVLSNEASEPLASQLDDLKIRVIEVLIEEISQSLEEK